MAETEVSEYVQKYVSELRNGNQENAIDSIPKSKLDRE